MKIIYFYQYFSTPSGSWGTRVYEFTKNWVQLGHDVTVITSIYSKSDLKAKGIIENQIIDGIKVKIINVTIDNKQSKIKRIYTFLVYMVLSCIYSVFNHADVVIASSGPLTTGIPGLISKLFGKKLVFEVRDLWPDTAIAMGMVKNKLLKKFLYALEALVYKRSDLIVTLSQGMQENINKRFGYHKIITVPNAANLDLFSKINGNVKLPEFYTNHKVAIYTGNIGKVNNTYLLVDAAKELERLNSNVIILLVGQGQQRDEIADFITSNKLKNIEFLDIMPKNELISYIKSAMISLVPLSPDPVLDTSSPNKLFESLAAGIPVMQTTNGWLKTLVEEYDCGITLSADDPIALANKLDELSTNKSRQDQLCSNALLAARNFNKDDLSKKMINAISKL